MTAIVRLGEILRAAIARGDLHRVRELLERGAPPNERGDHGTTALHWAAAADECEMVRALLQAGADPNARAADGCTPLHYAAREDAVRSVATLLDHGADPSMANDASRVPAEEIYDNQDDPDGVEIARALAEATRRAADDDDAPGRASVTNRLETKLATSGASTAVSFKSLELAMADMSAALRAERESAQTVDDDQHVSESGTGTGTGTGTGMGTGTASASSSGGTVSSSSSGPGPSAGRVLVPRAYVPAASHDEAAPARSAPRSVKVRLSSDGSLSDADYAAIRASSRRRGTAARGAFEGVRARAGGGEEEHGVAAGEGGDGRGRVWGGRGRLGGRRRGQNRTGPASDEHRHENRIGLHFILFSSGI